MSIDPTGLTLLATIADAGSLSAAARACGLSQPALTKQLRKLEVAAGVALFERGVRGVQPTEYGAALLPRARIIRAQAMQGAEELAQLRGRREGQVRIALSHLATLTLLPGILQAFRAAWPEVVLRIEPPAFPDRIAGLREGMLDFAVVTLTAAPLGAEYLVRPLCSTSVVAAVRDGHPLRQARSLGALVDAQWAMPNPQSSTAQTVAAAFQRLRLPAPRCPVTCDTLTGLEVLVAASDLIGAFPLEVYEARGKAAGLTRLGFDIGAKGSSLALVRWADARPTPAAAELEEQFVQAGRALARSRRSRR
jgi:LysR family transcriptional regulator of abg operon